MVAKEAGVGVGVGNKVAIGRTTTTAIAALFIIVASGRVAKGRYRVLAKKKA